MNHVKAIAQSEFLLQSITYVQYFTFNVYTNIEIIIINHDAP